MSQNERVTTVYATFRGYSGHMGGCKDKCLYDEWLCDLYADRFSAREAVKRFGEGKSFDDETETRITRYFRDRPNLFLSGQEVALKEDATHYEWMRYAEFPVHGPVSQESQGI